MYFSLQNIKFAELPTFEGTCYMRGMHGYDNTDEDMRGIFLAFGPGMYLHVLESNMNHVFNFIAHFAMFMKDIFNLPELKA